MTLLNVCLYTKFKKNIIVKSPQVVQCVYSQNNIFTFTLHCERHNVLAFNPFEAFTRHSIREVMTHRESYY